MDYLEIPLYRGDDHTFEIEVLDERGKKANLQGYLIKADCYDVSTGELIWELSSEAEIRHKIGAMFVEIPSHYTKGAEWHTLAFDLELTDPQGKIATIAQGSFVLEKDITGNARG